MPFLTAQAKNKDIFHWVAPDGPLTRSMLVRKEKAMGWVALAQQLSGQPSPRLLIASPVPLELPDALPLPGLLFIGVPREQFDHALHRAASAGRSGEGASSTPPAHNEEVGSSSPVTAPKQEAQDETAEDPADFETFAEVNTTAAHLKVEPYTFFRSLTHGPTPAEAANVSSASSCRFTGPRPEWPKLSRARLSIRETYVRCIERESSCAHDSYTPGS